MWSYIYTGRDSECSFFAHIRGGIAWGRCVMFDEQSDGQYSVRTAD